MNFFDEELAIGQTIVGSLPTDVSAPLLVYLGKGNVALASLMNGIVTGLSPFILPPLLLLLTGIEFQIPIQEMILELFIIIVLPMFLLFSYEQNSRLSVSMNRSILFLHH